MSAAFKLSTDRLYRHMKMEGVTATMLAEKVGLSRQAVYNIMNARSQPKPETLEAIARALNCSTWQLLGSDERDDDHEKFVAILTARLHHEFFDVENAVREYVNSWFFEHYDDLGYEDMKEAREVIDEQGGDFARNFSSLLKAYRLLNILGDDHARQAAIHAINLFFDVLSTMLIMDYDPDINIHDLGEE